MSHIFGVFSDKKFIKFNANAMKDQQSIEEEIKALAKCRDMKRKLLEARNQKPKVTFKTDKAGNIEVSPSAPCNSPEENSSDTDSIGDHADLLQRSSDSDIFDDAVDYDKIKADSSDSNSDDRTEEDHATVDGAIAKAIEKKNLQTVFHISRKGEDGIPVTSLPPSRRASAGSKQAAKAADEESSVEISDKERRQAQSNSKEDDEASKSSSSSTPSVVFIERSRLSIPSMLSFSDRATDVDDAADDEDTSSTETGDEAADNTIVIHQPAEIHISDGSSSSLKRPAPNKESRSSLGNQYDLVSSCLSVSANKAQALEDARPPRLAENSVIRTSCHVHAQGLGNKRASFIALIKGDSKETVSLNEGAEQDGKSQITHETDRESIQTLDPKEVESAEKLAESLISKALYEKPNEEGTPKLIVQKPKQIKPLSLKEVQARVNRKNKGKLQIHMQSFVKPPVDIERDQKHELKKQRMAELKERNEFLKQLFPKAAIDFVDSDEDDFEVEPVPSSMAMMTHKLITLEMHAEQNANFLKQLNDRIAALEPIINENNPSEPNKVSSEEQDLLRLIDDTEVMFYEMDSLQPKFGEFMYMMNDSEVERDAKTLERKETINLGETLEHKEHVMNKMQALRKRIKAGGDGTVIDDLTPSPKLQERFKSNKPRRSSEVTIKLSS